MEGMGMNCRFCNSLIHHIFADLGSTPFANSYLKQNELEKPRNFYPLKAYVCSKCFLVQSEKFQPSEKLSLDNHNFSIKVR